MVYFSGIAILGVVVLGFQIFRYTIYQSKK